MRFLFLGLVLSAGLFGQKVSVEFDPAVDFHKFNTFAIRVARLASKSPQLNGELVRKRINFDIQSAFEKKGLAFVENGPASLNVVYTLGSVRESKLEAYPAGWWGTRIIRVPFTEGTLVIDLRDPSTKSLVWRTIAREDKSDADHIERKLDDMVRKSVDKYPPKR
jgi:hypothetical protein